MDAITSLALSADKDAKRQCRPKAKLGSLILVLIESGAADEINGLCMKSCVSESSGVATGTCQYFPRACHARIYWL